MIGRANPRQTLRIRFAFLLGSILIAAGQAAWSAPPGDSSLSYSFDFSPPVITKIGGYDRVTMAGCEPSYRTGEPVLPVKGAAILIPDGMSATGVALELGAEVALPGTYCVEPAAKPYPLNRPELAQKANPNASIYESTDSYPPAVLCDAIPQVKKGYRILFLSLCPVRYVPAVGKLSYYERITVNIGLGARRTEAGGVGIRNLESDRRDVGRLLVNPDVMETYSREKAAADGGEAYKHIIITTGALESAFEPLRDYRIAKGDSSAIFTTEWIYSNYEGMDNQEKIRNFIRYAYENLGAEYVLLGGYSAFVPPRMLWVVAEDPDEPEPIIDYMPSDVYYGCLDGDYNSDGDDQWGEPTDGPGGEDVDLAFEVHVGRICAATETEVANVTGKIMAYEDSQDAYLRVASMVGEWLGFGGVAEYATDSMEQIRLGGTYDGYTTSGFASDSWFDTSQMLYESPSYSWYRDDMIGLINDYTPQIINHLGHANYTYNLQVSTSSLSLLENSRPFFGYSQGCNAGGFDVSNCWCEVITTMSAGAFGFVGNARYGFGLSYSTDGPSQRFNRPFWHALFADGIHELGAMNSYSKEYNIYRINGPVNRWIFYETNLFGDPAVKIRTGASVPTPTPTVTATFTPTPTMTAPPTFTPTVSPTPTITISPTPTPTMTAPPTSTPTSTPSATPTPPGPAPTVTPAIPLETPTPTPSGILKLAASNSEVSTGDIVTVSLSIGEAISSDNKFVAYLVLQTPQGRWFSFVPVSGGGFKLSAGLKPAVITGYIPPLEMMIFTDRINEALPRGDYWFGAVLVEMGKGVTLTDWRDLAIYSSETSVAVR